MATIGNDETEENDVNLYEYMFSRKLRDAEKADLIVDWQSYPCLWTSGKVFCREDKTKAMEQLTAKFSLSEDAMKKVLHSLKSSFIREVRRSMEDEKFQSSWKFYNQMQFMKDDVVRSLTQENVKEWSAEETEKLIELYESNPVLWDYSSKEYRDRNLRKLAMDTVKSSLGPRSEEEIKSQWHSLKTIYQREQKREEGSKKSGSSTSEVYKTKWKFFTPMSFISSIVNVDMSRSTCPDSEVLPTPPGSAPTGRKRRSNSEGASTDLKKAEFYQTCIEALKPTNEGCRTEEETFGKVVADTLARFTDIEKAIAKKKINDIIFELEMGFYKNNAGLSVQGTSGIYTPSPMQLAPMQQSVQQPMQLAPMQQSVQQPMQLAPMQQSVQQPMQQPMQQSHSVQQSMYPPMQQPN